jgi:hypothetical protein
MTKKVKGFNSAVRLPDTETRNLHQETNNKMEKFIIVALQSSLFFIRKKRIKDHPLTPTRSGDLT